MAKERFNSIILKIGSSSLTTSKGNLDIANLKKLVAEAAALIKQKKQVVIVTSGAIVAGKEKLKIGRPKSIPEKQAAAAVGQSRLMRQYEKAFEAYGITTAQVLLTRDAIADRERYLNARHCLATLLTAGIVPIVNENDTVAIDEIKIGDNDTLAALTASMLGADLLLLLTDVDGFYMENEEGVSYLVPEIKEIDAAVEAAAGHPSTQLGTGGMQTKLQAAKICRAAGIYMAIINSRKKGLIERLLKGEKVGTLFIPKAAHLESRKRWLAHGLKCAGTLMVDPGAEAAILHRGKSLLLVGIKALQGNFEAGALLSIVDENGKEFARGLASVGSNALKAQMGKKGAGEAVHRDNLVILS